MGHYILRSTLGDPTADFTYLLMQWTMPGLAGNDLKPLNIPGMEEATQIYCCNGTAANAKATESAKRTVPLSKASWEYAQKAGAT